tara:strand:+ start:48 stop:398 length:351 start_codon:yes stop_codon:yes gene_type:complete
MNEKLKAVIEKHKVIVAAYDCYSEDEWEYDDFNINMLEVLKDMGNVWEIECKNANWRGSTGYMESSDPYKVISAILMHDGQCRTEVWEGEDNTLDGVCYHHDCPTGSWFTITGQIN